MTQVALIISHGQPSDPEPAEAELAHMAAKVAALLPGWRVGSATLAAAGSLARAVAELGGDGRAYPLFMAGGWFTRVQLPAKLAEAGGPLWRVLEPLGCDPAVHDLAVRIVRDAGAEVGGADRVLLAAHGSHQSRVPADIARHVADLIERATGVPAEARFIDQAPQLSGAAGFGPGSVCLPFFAAEGGHVTQDIPAALRVAGFQGRLLPAIGLHPDIAQIIARAIASGDPVCVGRCKWQSDGSSD